MPRPDGGLITETNRQYYAGAQQFYISSAGAGQTFTSTFNTNLIYGSSDNANTQYGLNNFKIYSSADGLNWLELTPDNSKTTAINTNSNVSTGEQTLTITSANVNIAAGMTIQNTAGTQIYGTVKQVLTTTTFVCTITIQIPANVDLVFKFIEPFTEANNVVTVKSYLAANSYIKIQLIESAIEENYNNYSYTKLTDVINNFIVGYVGVGKLIPSVERTDVIFHARRGLQEFSYDTLKSVKSQELSINSALNVIIPQDYVNYVRFSWVDKLGIQHTIYPANELTTNPYANPVQDNTGTPTQDNFDSNIQGTSQTEEAWSTNTNEALSENLSNINTIDHNYNDGILGQRYGLQPQTSQKNGWFTINEREGKISFSSNLKGKLIIFEYISDGNAYDIDIKIPKLAEEALYAHILHAILSTRVGIQEYVVRRFKQERSAKLRNAKIRLSNLKLDQVIQVMRGKSKWIK